MDPMDGKERSKAATIAAIQSNGSLFKQFLFIERHLSSSGGVYAIAFLLNEATCVPPHQPVVFLSNT
jgi:hypothetical protein